MNQQNTKLTPQIYKAIFNQAGAIYPPHKTFNGCFCRYVERRIDRRNDQSHDQPVDFMRSTIRRRGIPLIAAILSSWLIFPAHPASGQFNVVHAPARVHTGQTTNFYISIDSSIRFDGVYLEIPEDWKLEHVTLVSESGHVSDVSFRPLDAFSSRYQLIPTRRFTDKGRVILRMKAGGLSGPSFFRITPFKSTNRSFENSIELLDALSLRHDVRVNSERKAPGNLVLELPPNDFQPRVISEQDMSAPSAFTTEFWLKTASSNAIIISTWDGKDESSYPLELVLDGVGHLVFYRGVPGEHRSMRSGVPVADGMWHHVSVTHDGDARWSRMYVDGQASDSLYHQSPLSIQNATELVLGGRHVELEPQRPNTNSFTGYIDEIRIWSIARDQQTVRASMHQHLVSRAGEVEVISFDDGYSWRSDRVDEKALVVLSDLSYYESIRDFDVNLEVSSVLLTWRGVDPNVAGYGVERSDDGMNYSEIDRMDTRSESTVDRGNSSFQYRDTAIPGSVAFYRIRQFFADGVEIVSAVVKIGMGTEDPIESGSIT
ncbi:MAG: LamG domain-containing protein, partial [Bacteroidetes bacterium]